MAQVNYKYNEGKLLEELKAYIDKTYGQHYSLNKFQATEFIIDSGHGVGFTVGNVMKYAQRYGKKDGRNRQDILKVLHYALMLLYVHDLEVSSTNTDDEKEDEFASDFSDAIKQYIDLAKEAEQKGVKPGPGVIYKDEWGIPNKGYDSISYSLKPDQYIMRNNKGA